MLGLWILNLIVALNFRSVLIFQTWLGYLYFSIALLGIAVSGWKLFRRTPIVVRDAVLEFSWS